MQAKIMPASDAGADRAFSPTGPIPDRLHFRQYLSHLPSCASVTSLLRAADWMLSGDDIAALEALAITAGVNARGWREKEMQVSDG